MSPISRTALAAAFLAAVALPAFAQVSPVTGSSSATTQPHLSTTDAPQHHAATKTHRMSKAATPSTKQPVTPSAAPAPTSQPAAPKAN